MTFYRSNLLIALNIAMKQAREQERAQGYTGDSGFVGGLQELADAIKSGETVITIKD